MANPGKTLIGAATHANAVQCPDPGCTQTFTCDACLHEHLMASANVRYSDIFGPAREPWADFCDGHADFSPAAL